MKEYNYLQAIYMSFYSRKLYRDIVNNWGAGVVLYLFILLAICWTITVLRYQPNINASFKLLANEYGSQIPPIKIQKGKATTPEDKPYIIKDPNTDEDVAIIDISGKYKNLNEAPEGVKVLITKDKIYYYKDKDTVQIQTIPESLTISIKPDQVKEKLIHFVGWSWLFFLPILLTLSFVYRLVQALLYAIIGKIFAAVGDVPLSYSNVLKLSMIAVTPSIILATVLDWFNVNFNYEWLLYFIISMAFLIFGIRANKKQVN